MSTSLHKAIEFERQYLQSPVDDIESFYWVLLWAVLFNKHTTNRSDDEVTWQKLISGSRADRLLASTEINEVDGDGEHSPIVLQFAPVLQSLGAMIEKLRRAWNHVVAKNKKRIGSQDAGDFWLPEFHKFAYYGVHGFLKVVEEHRERLKQCPAFGPC